MRLRAISYCRLNDAHERVRVLIFRCRRTLASIYLNRDQLDAKHNHINIK